MITIRKVTNSDFPTWLKLRKTLWPKEEIHALYQEMQEIYSKIDENPVFLAFSDDDIAGFIECSIHLHAPGCKTKKIAYIEGWFVYEHYRFLGIGRALMEEAFTWSRSFGITEVASDTTIDYPLSPKAHEAIGFIETVPLHYVKLL
ncbi:MAG: N-acetyltransferase family protein [Candidatus Izemoplasmataceae bacterium]